MAEIPPVDGEAATEAEKWLDRIGDLCAPIWNNGEDSESQLALAEHKFYPAAEIIFPANVPERNIRAIGVYTPHVEHKYQILITELPKDK